MSEHDDSSEPKGLLGSVSRLVDQVVHFLITKLELFQVEVEEEWRRIATMLVLLISAAVLGQLCLIAFTALIIAIFRDHIVITLILITLLYGGTATVLAMVLKNKLKTTKTKLFSTTLSELRKDREWLHRGR
jgi:uncharacterized membrane protein YqjE